MTNVPEKAIQAAAEALYQQQDRFVSSDPKMCGHSEKHVSNVKAARIAVEAAAPHLDLAWMNTATELAKQVEELTAERQAICDAYGLPRDTDRLLQHVEGNNNLRAAADAMSIAALSQTVEELRQALGQAQKYLYGEPHGPACTRDKCMCVKGIIDAALSPGPEEPKHFEPDKSCGGWCERCGHHDHAHADPENRERCYCGCPPEEPKGGTCNWCGSPTPLHAVPARGGTTRICARCKQEYRPDNEED